jgi:hypothetical protein
MAYLGYNEGPIAWFMNKRAEAREKSPMGQLERRVKLLESDMLNIKLEKSLAIVTNEQLGIKERVEHMKMVAELDSENYSFIEELSDTGYKAVLNPLTPVPSHMRSVSPVALVEILQK